MRLVPLQIPKSSDAQVPYITWRRSMHTFGPSHPQTHNCGLKTVQVFTEKNISGPMQFKPMLFRGQLYFLLHYHSRTYGFYPFFLKLKVYLKTFEDWLPTLSWTRISEEPVYKITGSCIRIMFMDQGFTNTASKKNFQGSTFNQQRQK